jgi:hypothetical protein
MIMMFLWGRTSLALVVVLAATSIGHALGNHKPSLHSFQGINIWKLLHQRATGAGTTIPHRYAGSGTHDRASQVPLHTTDAEFEFHAETFVQPLDHFGNSTDATFEQRFWVNKRHYLPRLGAPVIMIDAGETSGEGRLPFLDTGIADILARATGGVGVVLEHRYYGMWALLLPGWAQAYEHMLADTGDRVLGKSIGVQNFSTDALRCVLAYLLYSGSPCRRLCYVLARMSLLRH